MSTKRFIKTCLIFCVYYESFCCSSYFLNCCLLLFFFALKFWIVNNKPSNFVLFVVSPIALHQLFYCIDESNCDFLLIFSLFVSEFVYFIPICLSVCHSLLLRFYVRINVLFFLNSLTCDFKEQKRNLFHINSIENLDSSLLLVLFYMRLVWLGHIIEKHIVQVYSYTLITHNSFLNI